AQVFLQHLPRLGGLTEPGQHGRQGGAHGLLGSGAFQARECDPEPRLILALHCTPPLVSRLDVPPLRVEVGRHPDMNDGCVWVIVGELVAVSGWSSVSRRRRISTAFSNSGCAWAYFPCAWRLNARSL